MLVVKLKAAMMQNLDYNLEVNFVPGMAPV